MMDIKWFKCDNSFVGSQLSTDHFVTILVEKIVTNGHFHKYGKYHILDGFLGVRKWKIW